MKKIVAVLALCVSTTTFAQQQGPSLEQVDQALAIARMAAANEIAVKDQRIAAISAELNATKQELEKLKADAAKSTEKAEPKK